MSFRWRLFVAILVSLLIATALESAVDAWRIRQRTLDSIAQALDTLERLANAAISFDESGPKLPGLSQSLPEGSRFRVLRESEAVISVDATEPEAELSLRYRPLPAGYQLELAVDTRPFYAELRRLIGRDLIDDALQIALAIVIALALSHFLLKPIRRLSAALDELSRQEFPEAIPVPPGRDELSRLAESFNRMSAGIQAAFERERVFTRYASHELRTPLSALKVQLEALELGLSPLAAVLPKAQRHTERMQRVLEALLSLARAAERKHEPVAAARLVEETLQLLPLEQRQRVTLAVEVAPEVKLEQPYLFGQCLLNLVDNALKYSDKQVTVVLRERSGQLELRVEDEGGGVPEAVIDKLTHTFFRLASQTEGSGLGLAFVRHIAQTFGGELTLANTERGLAVTLKLPFIPPHLPAAYSAPLP